MFKKSLLAAIIVSGFSFNAAQAVDGTINFTGKIIAAACDIKTGDENQTKVLGDVNSTMFSNAGSTAGAVDFSINVESCDATISNARVVFDGTRDATNNQLLEINGAAPATGVGIALYNADGTTLIPMGGVSMPVSVSSATNAAELKFVAKYMSTTSVAGIVPGDANGTAQFTMQYQ
uniref:fimbrial protein n=1 Tax=Serratia proteamaculans TaxID=28151 RepID=UPI001F4C44C1|nr:fimbrial protein [Serratia proteamaculans]ULG17712.1 fimbrial protein [Serratia proteamaculans]